VELIEVETPPTLARGTSFVLRHRDTDLERGLEPGELVVIGTPDGLLHAGRVEGIEFELDDTVYTLAVGGRLPPDLARERIEGLDPGRHDLAIHEIVEMLGDL